MKLRNAHSGRFVLPWGPTVTPGEEFEAPEAWQSHALVEAGVFARVIEHEIEFAHVAPPAAPAVTVTIEAGLDPELAAPRFKAPRGSRGGK